MIPFDRGPTRPAFGKIPFPGHRTMEDVMIEEAQGQERRRIRWKQRYRLERSSWRKLRA